MGGKREVGEGRGKRERERKREKASTLCHVAPQSTYM